MLLKRIRYFADMSPGTGYGNAARGYVRALETLGYTPETLHIVPAISAYGGVQVDAGDWLRPYVIGSWLEQEDINIVHTGPGLLANYWTAKRYNIAITAWETNKLPTAKGKPPCMPDSPPLNAAEALNLFDEVWAPSQHCAYVFTASGVSADKVKVIPHCLWYDPKPRRLEVIKYMRFYYIGSWNERKNPIGLLRAYWNTGWVTSSPVSLFMHALPSSREPNILEANDFRVRADIDLLREALPPERRMNLPTYVPSTQYRPPEWIQDAHDNGDAFVTASRGEGFCLPALEALSAGNIVLGGGGPAIEEFAEALGDLAAEMLCRLPCVSVPITPMPEMLGYELDQEWWETSIADLTDSLKEMPYRLKTVGNQVGIRQEAARRVQEFYAPARIADLCMRRLLEEV